MFTNIDTKQLEAVNGGVMPGPNGEGCTEPRPPFGPKNPGPTFPGPTSPSPTFPSPTFPR